MAGRMYTTMFISTTVGILLLVNSAVALDNGLGRTPGLGWNSDYCTNCSKSSLLATHGLLGGFENEAFIAHIANFMHDTPILSGGGKTFQQLGFHYINMDSYWNLKTRDANGDLMPGGTTRVYLRTIIRLH